MNNKHYPAELSIRDCLAILLGLNINHLRKGNYDSLLDEAHRSLGYAASALEEQSPTADRETIEKLEHRANTAAEFYSSAIRYEARFSGEIVKARKGITAILVITRDNQSPESDYSAVFVSTQSFIDLAQEAFNIELTADDLTLRLDTKDTVEAPLPVKYTANDKEKHEVIIALLTEELADALGSIYRLQDGPNYRKIAEKIAVRIESQEIKMNGIAVETLKKKLSGAMKRKEEFTPDRK